MESCKEMLVKEEYMDDDDYDDDDHDDDDTYHNYPLRCQVMMRC